MLVLRIVVDVSALCNGPHFAMQCMPVPGMCYLHKAHTVQYPSAMNFNGHAAQR
jgi:hypothetical protein